LNNVFHTDTLSRLKIKVKLKFQFMEVDIFGISNFSLPVQASFAVDLLQKPKSGKHFKKIKIQKSKCKITNQNSKLFNFNYLIFR